MSKLLGALCLLAAFLILSSTPSIAQEVAQSAPAAAPTKPAKLDTKVERNDRSEQQKREELGKKLERRRNELNSTPTNSLMPSNSRSVKSQDGERQGDRDASRSNSDSKSRVKK